MSTVIDKVRRVATNKNGKYLAGSLKKDFYSKKGLESLYYKVIEDTSFLDVDTSFRERLFYLENNYTQQKICKYCNTNKLKYKKCEKSLGKTCGSLQCKRRVTSKTQLDRYDKMRLNEEEWSLFKKEARKRVLKASEKVKSWSKDKRDKHYESIAKKNRGRKQSEETIRKRANSRKGYKHSKEVIRRISETNKKTKKNNPQVITKETRDKISRILIDKISKGEFTPKQTNSYTHWSYKIIIRGRCLSVRSSWEALFYTMNPHLSYEKTRIKYVDSKGKSRVYIVDFTDEDSRVLYEVKPKSKIMESKYKIRHALDWCEHNGYTFQIITEDWFIGRDYPESVFKTDFYKNVKKYVLK